MMLKRLCLGIAIVLGLVAEANGLFMLYSPNDWYFAVPGVTTTGPFNQHFIRDIGLIFLSVGTAFLVGTSRPQFRLDRVSRFTVEEHHRGCAPCRLRWETRTRAPPFPRPVPVRPPLGCLLSFAPGCLGSFDGRRSSGHVLPRHFLPTRTPDGGCDPCEVAEPWCAGTHGMSASGNPQANARNRSGPARGRLLVTLPTS